MSKSLNFALALSLLAAPVLADGFGLGRPATDAEIAAWDIDVRPDGTGLPEGAGTVAQGEEIFAERCAICHGDFGEGVDRWPVLAGGHDSLSDERPVKTIGSYWPYLSTTWDFINRAMPFGDAQSLKPDEVYAIVAYIMYVNDMVDDEEFELSRENFLDIPMVNEANFIGDDRAETEYSIFTEACMDACKESVEITEHAAVIDVTPEETETKAARDAVASGGATDESAAAPAIEEPATQVAAIDEALVASGAKVFRKCKACHQIGEGAKHRTGPILNDLFGRVAGSVEGFKYSKPMIAAGEGGLVWNAETIATYLIKPGNMVKGTKMAFAGLRKEEDRLALIAYLRSMQ